MRANTNQADWKDNQVGAVQAAGGGRNYCTCAL